LHESSTDTLVLHRGRDRDRPDSGDPAVLPEKIAAADGVSFREVGDLSLKLIAPLTSRHRLAGTSSAASGRIDPISIEGNSHQCSRLNGATQALAGRTLAAGWRDGLCARFTGPNALWTGSSVRTRAYEALKQRPSRRKPASLLLTTGPRRRANSRKQIERRRRSREPLEVSQELSGRAQQLTCLTTLLHRGPRIFNPRNGLSWKSTQERRSQARCI
jgi:hypothetical protein